MMSKTARAFEQGFRDAEPAEAAEPLSVLSTATSNELDARDFPERTFILSPWLADGEQALIHAFRGAGKSWVSLGCASAIAGGGRFLRWGAPAPRQVLFIDGEMGGRRVRSRQEVLKKTAGLHGGENLRLWSPGLFSDVTSLNLADARDRALIERTAAHHDSSAIVLDNLSSLYRGTGDPNGEAYWEPLQTWMIQWRVRGVSCIAVAHSGKDGNRGSRGSSRLEDTLDVVMQLSKIESGTAGCRFRLVYTKIRDFGPDLMPFDATLLEDRWEVTSAADGSSDAGGSGAFERQLTTAAAKIAGVLEKAEREATREGGSFSGLNATALARVAGGKREIHIAARERLIGTGALVMVVGERGDEKRYRLARPS